MTRGSLDAHQPSPAAAVQGVLLRLGRPCPRPCRCQQRSLGLGDHGQRCCGSGTVAQRGTRGGQKGGKGSDLRRHPFPVPPSPLRRGRGERGGRAEDGGPGDGGWGSSGERDREQDPHPPGLQLLAQAQTVGRETGRMSRWSLSPLILASLPSLQPKLSLPIPQGKTGSVLPQTW